MTKPLSPTNNDSFHISIQSHTSSPTTHLKRKHRTTAAQFRTHTRDFFSCNARTSFKRWLIALLSTLVIIIIIYNSDTHRVLFKGSKNLGALSLLVPKVDRAAFDKLRLVENYQKMEDVEAGSFTPNNDKVSNSKLALDRNGNILDVLPTVTAVPDIIKPKPTDPNHQKIVRRAAIEYDAETCPGQKGGCAFLVPAWIGEQETKAQLHLHQLGLLAMSLNRTLVLPNVAKSRFGTCNASPFSFYYSPASLVALGIPTITHEEFINWSIIRDPYPSAQVVSITGARADYPVGSIEIDAAADPHVVSGKPSRNLCLRSPKSRLNFTQRSPLTIYPPVNWQKSSTSRQAFGDSVVNTLSSKKVGVKSMREISDAIPWSSPAVLAFNYELRYKILTPAMVVSFSPESEQPLPFDYFPYDSRWTDIAEEITSRLSPFIAVHWRTETLAPANLIPCATALVAKLMDLKKKNPTIKTVYLATDYPIEDLEGMGGGETKAVSIPHSGTFGKSVTESHHRAFKLFLREFKRRATGLELTTFSKEYSLTTNSSPLAQLDSGLIGIVDKSVALKAEIFLAAFAGPGEGVCGKKSSFTTQIIEGRKLEGNGQPEQVYHWSLRNGGEG